MDHKRQDIEIQDPGFGEPAAAVAVIEPAPVSAPDGVIKSGKLAGMTMWRAVWVLSWPVLLEMFLNSLMGVTDTTLAAGISEAATDAIGAAVYFMWFVGLVPIALGVGATALISRALGRGRPALAGTVVGQCVGISVFFGLIFAGITYIAAPTVADWQNLKGDAHDFAVTFIRTTSLAVPAQTFLSVGIACCRGIGDSMRPLLTMGLVNAINIVLSFVLSGAEFGIGQLESDGQLHRHILVPNHFGFHMGVAGIALGTALAWTLGSLVMLGLLIRGVHDVRLRARRLRPHWHTIRRILRIGFPNFLETFGMWFGNFLTILLVGWMAVPGLLGAHMVAIRIEAFSFLPGFAMSLAAATLAGQYLGAGSPALARRAVWRCTYIASALMGTAGILFVFCGGAITGIFSQQHTHLEMVPRLLAVTGLVQIPFALSIVFRSALRGAGDTKSPMWITWISTYLVRFPLAWLFCGVDLPLPGGHTIPNPAPLQSFGVHPLVGFWIGLCSEIVIRAILFTLSFIGGAWTKARV